MVLGIGSAAALAAACFSIWTPEAEPRPVHSDPKQAGVVPAPSAAPGRGDIESPTSEAPRARAVELPASVTADPVPPTFAAVPHGPDSALPPAVLRLPALDGLRLDPAATVEELARHHAEFDADALARSRFRLGSVLELFHGGACTSPIAWLLPSDVEAVQRELTVVDERIATRAAPELVNVDLMASLEDGEVEYAARHLGASAEELFVRADRLERARLREEQRVLERLWATGDYEVMPEHALMT